MPSTVKKTFEIARATGNHLLVQLKVNQAKLFDVVSAIADSTAATETDFTRNTVRSHQEDRTVEVFPVGDDLIATEWHPFVKTIIRITRHTLLRSAATGLWKQRGEVSYYLSSATGLTAVAWGVAIRGHWGIENRNHYVRDVSCEEDKCRIRDNPGIMARARSFALNILRKNGVANVAKALWDGALNLDHILAYKKI
jgi:predicted transposase YbfD/YdcC